MVIEKLVRLLECLRMLSYKLALRVRRQPALSPTMHELREYRKEIKV